MLIGPTKARNTSKYSEIAANKKAGCPDYSRCLKTVIENNWSQWQCLHCRKFYRPLPVSKEVRVYTNNSEVHYV